ncbi:hypothetical protein HDU79_006886 [Rhizoclosmatium sp. JEL0117]|nr:hypothetical protein HDU79_006886 [Rhizoclosmatium sp. JEL0117]
MPETTSPGKIIATCIAELKLYFAFGSAESPSLPPVSSSASGISADPPRTDRTQLRSALKSAGNSRFSLNGSNTSLTRSSHKVAFDALAVDQNKMDRKSIVEMTRASSRTSSAMTANSLIVPYNMDPILSNENMNQEELPQDADKKTRPLSSRPMSAASITSRAALRMRSISANAYGKEVKLTGFEFRRNPVVEALAEQLIETRRQETEHMNRLLLLRLTNPWSSIKNSEVLFTDYAWNQIHQDFGKPQRPKTAPSSAKKSPRRSVPAVKMPDVPPPEPTRRDIYFAKLATPRPKHFNDPLPPEIPTPRNLPGPPDLERLEALARPRQIHPPYQSPIVYPGCTDAQRKKPVRIREIDPAVFNRLTKPKTVIRPEDIEPLHVPQVKRSKIGQRLMKEVKSRIDAAPGPSSQHTANSGDFLAGGDMDVSRNESFAEPVVEGRFTLSLRPKSGATNVAVSQVFVDMYEHSTGLSSVNLNEEGAPSGLNIYQTQDMEPAMETLEKQESILSISRPSINLNMEIMVQRPSVSPAIVEQDSKTSHPISEESAIDTPAPPEANIIISPDPASSTTHNLLELTEEHHAAAVKLQSTFRGFALRKRLSLVDDNRAWDLRASTIQPDYVDNTRQSISQGYREEEGGPLSLAQSMHIMRSISGSRMIMEEKEEGEEVDENGKKVSVVETHASARPSSYVSRRGSAAAGLGSVTIHESATGSQTGLKSSTESFGMGKKLHLLPTELDARSANISIRPSVAVDGVTDSQQLQITDAAHKKLESLKQENEGSDDSITLGKLLHLLPKDLEGHSTNISTIGTSVPSMAVTPRIDTEESFGNVSNAATHGSINHIAQSDEVPVVSEKASRVTSLRQSVGKGLDNELSGSKSQVNSAPAVDETVEEHFDVVPEPVDDYVDAGAEEPVPEYAEVVDEAMHEDAIPSVEDAVDNYSPVVAEEPITDYADEVLEAVPDEHIPNFEDATDNAVESLPTDNFVEDNFTENVQDAFESSPPEDAIPDSFDESHGIENEPVSEIFEDVDSVLVPAEVAESPIEDTFETAINESPDTVNSDIPDSIVDDSLPLTNDSNRNSKSHTSKSPEVVTSSEQRSSQAVVDEHLSKRFKSLDELNPHLKAASMSVTSKSVGSLPQTQSIINTSKETLNNATEGASVAHKSMEQLRQGSVDELQMQTETENQ